MKMIGEIPFISSFTAFYFIDRNFYVKIQKCSIKLDSLKAERAVFYSPSYDILFNYVLGRELYL